MTSCFCQLVPLSHVLGMQHESSKTTQPGRTGCNWRFDVVKTSYLRCNCCMDASQWWSSQWTILSLVLLVCTPALQRCRPREHSKTQGPSRSWTQGPSWSWNTEIRPLKFCGIKPCKGLGIFVKWFFCPRSLPRSLAACFVCTLRPFHMISATVLHRPTPGC